MDEPTRSSSSLRDLVQKYIHVSADVPEGTLLKWILNAAKPLNPIQFFLFPDHPPFPPHKTFEEEDNILGEKM